VLYEKRFASQARSVREQYEHQFMERYEVYGKMLLEFGA